MNAEQIIFEYLTWEKLLNKKAYPCAERAFSIFYIIVGKNDELQWFAKRIETIQ